MHTLNDPLKIKSLSNLNFVSRLPLRHGLILGALTPKTGKPVTPMIPEQMTPPLSSAPCHPSSMTSALCPVKYVLITPARNEDSFITKTLDSVVTQTVLAERWVIVDDGSTDETAEIVSRYAVRYPWIELIRLPQRQDRNFAAKVQAVNIGLERVQEFQFEVLGNLDADVSFEADYMEFVMQKFAEDPELGVAGTPFTQDGQYDSRKDSFEGENYVAGPCQLFRRKCFQEIGGYVPNRAGGVDWIAVMTARMKGWKVRSFSEKRYHHHRVLGTAGKGALRALFSYGEKDYYLGGSPIWQLFRVTYRMTKKPVCMGGLALLIGYCWAAMRRMEHPVSRELMRFHREEQLKKLSAILRALLKFKKVDSFHLLTEEIRFNADLKACIVREIRKWLSYKRT